MKKFLIFIAVILVLGLLVFCFRSPIAKFGIESFTSAMLGAPVKVGSVTIDVLKRELDIRDFRIYNPKGFPKELIMYIPEMKACYDENAFFKGKVDIIYLDAEIEEIVVVKDAQGNFNVDSLNLDKEKWTKWQREHFNIELFELSIARVVYKDYTAKEDPLIKVYDIKVKDKVYENVPGMSYFFTIIFQDAMASAAIKGATVMGVITAAGAVGIAGPVFWPAGLAILLVSPDSVATEFNTSVDNLYSASLEVLQDRGKITQEDEKEGIIRAKVRGHKVTVKIKRKTSGAAGITISARKLYVPTAMYAKVLLYYITEKIAG